MQKWNDDVFQNTTHKIESVNIGSYSGDNMYSMWWRQGYYVGEQISQIIPETVLDFSNGRTPHQDDNSKLYCCNLGAPLFAIQQRAV